MKKWIIIFLLFLLVLAVSLYIFIPNKLTVSATALIPANSNAVFRYLANKDKWEKWWPKKATNSATATNNRSYYYQNFSYQLSGPSVDAVPILIESDNFAAGSALRVLPSGADTTVVEWICRVTTTANPVKKVMAYVQANALKKNMEAIVKSLQSFLAKKENIYGIQINETKVKDTALVTTKAIADMHPTPTFIYNLLARLEQYIASKQALATNYPMLHVDSLNEHQFEVQVAIPVNKILPGNPSISFKRMVAGNILVAEVRGGNKTTEQALAEMENYMSDHQRSSPAIPFVSLITNRLKEPDTTKWISKVFYPVY